MHAAGFSTDVIPDLAGTDRVIKGSGPLAPGGLTPFERCVAAGGVVVFPADTVYGLACDPANAAAVERLYALKGRRPDKPSALMYFDREAALAAVPDLGPRTRALLEALLPGGVTVVLPALGLHVPDVPLLAGVRRPVLQSSANLSGEPDPRRLEDVPESIRAGADLVLDGGELPGTPSTVLDLRDFERDGTWRILRAGAVPEATIAAAAGTLGA
jgi:L-threonylcarbamoyladenylate synthase